MEVTGTDFKRGAKNYLNGNEMNHSSLVVVKMFDKEVKENEPLVLNPIAVIEELEMPSSVSSDWVFESVKNFCHVVGLSCEGFKDQILSLFSAIEASRHKK